MPIDIKMGSFTFKISAHKFRKRQTNTEGYIENIVSAC